MDRLVSFDTLAQTFADTGAAPDGLHLTILGMEDTGSYALHGGTYKVDRITNAVAEEINKTTASGSKLSISPNIVATIWSGHAILELALFKSDCVIPSGDGEDIDEEAPAGIVQAVWWIGKKHDQDFVPKTARLLKVLRHKFTESGTDAIGMAQAFAVVLDIQEELDQAITATKAAKSKMEQPLLTAMARGTGTQQIKTGGRTLSVATDLYAGRATEIFEDAAAVEALTQDNGDHLIKETIASASWKKYLRDAVRDDDNKLPATDEQLSARLEKALPHLAPFIRETVRVFTKLNTRRAK